MNNIYYKNKYLKYKNKYLNATSNLRGGSNLSNEIITDYFIILNAVLTEKKEFTIKALNHMIRILNNNFTKRENYQDIIDILNEQLSIRNYNLSDKILTDIISIYLALVVDKQEFSLESLNNMLYIVNRSTHDKKNEMIAIINNQINER